MGVNIWIFANHQIKGKTFAERISAFEEKLDTKIQFLPNKPLVRENEPAKTNIPEEVIYYVGGEYDSNEDYFNNVGEIYIKTNYQYFYGLRLLKNTMINWPSVSTKMPYWEDNLGKLWILNNPFRS